MRNHRADLELCDNSVPDLGHLVVRMRRDQQRTRFSLDRNRHVHRGLFGVNKRDKPCRRRTCIGMSSDCRPAPGSLDRFALPRDADVTQPVEVVNNLVQPRFGVRCLVQSRNDRINEFARQPDDALIFGLNAGPGLEQKPRNIDGQTERQDEREQQVDPGTQGEFLPHRFCPE